MLANLIGGFIVILIGVTLMPVIGDEVAAARYYGGNTTNPTNLTGAASTITNLVTLFFALGVMSTGIALAVTGLRQAGLM